MIVLFTDYGLQDAYVGQLHAVLAQQAHNEVVVDLLHNVPNYDLRAGAYLLANYAKEFPVGTIFVCVIDPGVGSARPPLAIEADGKWFVGPGDSEPVTGLFTQVVTSSDQSHCYEIKWRPDRLSNSFHGRDLFAPAAAKLAQGHKLELSSFKIEDQNSGDWPDDLFQIIYIDHYGNAMSGVRVGQLSEDSRLLVGAHLLTVARTFSEVPRGSCFWYTNSIGLIEIAANQSSAAEILGIKVGDRLEVVK